MEDLISISKLGKSFKRGKEVVNVLHELNLKVPSGEFLALMGPSGSGKSTLLNLLGGLDQADAGDIVVAGENLKALPPGQLPQWRAQNIGFVFQFYHLLPMLTAEENVEVPLLLTNLSRPERRKRVTSALELVGLSNRSKHKPGELSGGQQQRVAIARAIVSDPALLLCDEPTGDLDRESSEHVLNLLELLSKEHNKTIVMVTHDPKAALHAHRRLHMDKGFLSESPLNHN